MESKITGGETRLIFQCKVLNKYDVKYYQCQETGFIQTEDPYWLNEAYSSAITKLDIGLVHRNQALSELIPKIILKCFSTPGRFLDYAGGYGLMTRMMRDKGFDFYHTDKYCINLFAENFDLVDLQPESNFQLVTAFEVFEHMTQPLEEIKSILQYSDTVLFSTELQPQQTFRSPDEWWYFIPETGQHISLFTEKSLQHIASLLGLNFYTDHRSLHLFSKKNLSRNPLIPGWDPFFIRKIARKMRKLMRDFDAKRNGYPEGLLEKDWAHIKAILSNRP